MTHDTLNYAAKIRECGFRLTPQRELILDAVCEAGGHTTVEEIYDRLQAKASAINLATVYRALDFLCDMRLVVTAEINGHKVFEIAGLTPHHHLVCRICGRVERLEHQAVKELFDKLRRERGFKVDTDHLVLFGQCKDCLAQEKKGSE